MTDTLSARELVHDLLPKLHATEKVVKNTLGQLIEQAQTEEVAARRTQQQAEFELEIAMIRMNLDHLMHRYAKEIETAVSGHADAALKLDSHERFAIDSARKLYARARDISHT